MVQSYSPCDANVPSREGTSAPPGKYDWTCFLRPIRVHSPNSKPTGSTILQISRQSVVGHIGATWRIQVSSCFLQPTPLHNPNGKSTVWAVFAQLTAKSPYTLQWAPLSPKLSLPMRIWIPIYHMIPCAKCQSEPTTQTASRIILDRLSFFAHMTAECPY